MERPSKTVLKRTDSIDVTLSVLSQKGHNGALNTERRESRHRLIFVFAFFFCRQTTLLSRQPPHHLALPLVTLTSAIAGAELPRGGNLRRVSPLPATEQRVSLGRLMDSIPRRKESQGRASPSALSGAARSGRLLLPRVSPACSWRAWSLRTASSVQPGPERVT